ncbi:MAG: putative transcriptional regulator [Natronomonas sp.]|jgi:predicted transcriptional regulator|uniref:hypothetical protein n=1 Tax=Natronomonas sp. TaxID=2184060 RepID=UPI0039E609B5
MIERLGKQLSKEQRDLEVLDVILSQHPIGISRIATEVGIDEHKVRYSLRMLENDELIESTPNGAVPVDDIGERIDAINTGLTDLAEHIDELRQYTLNR